MKLKISVSLIILSMTVGCQSNSKDTYDFSNVDKVIEQDISDGFPSAAIGIWYKGDIVKVDSYGYIKIHDEYTPKRPLGSTEHNNDVSLPNEKLIPTVDNTIYDLASNTKMFSTNYAIQYLVSNGKLDLDQHVSDILPEFADQPTDLIKGKAEITVRDLLQHQGGHQPSVEFYKETGDMYSQSREKTLNIMLKTELMQAPHTAVTYSDIDYMILGQIIEKITGMTQDKFMHDTFYQPMGLERTGYNMLTSPLYGNAFTSNDFAATEIYGNSREGQVHFNNIREYTLQGEVHDEKAYYSMGGVAGHAGLFSTVEDMLSLMSIMINGGEFDGVQYFSKETIEEFLTPIKNHEESGYALGWNINYRHENTWLFGRYASENTYGHSGWVGTASLIDPDNELMVILLSNKKNTHIKMDCGEAVCGAFEGDKMKIGDYDPIFEEIYKSLNLTD